MLDGEGRITTLAVYAPLQEENGEWIALKDAALRVEELGLSEGLAAEYSGACGFGKSSSTPEGDLSTIQINRCIFMLQRWY